MTLDAIFELPKETENATIYQLFFDTVTPVDIIGETEQETFAYAQLIEWAIRHKKYEEYYSYMKPFLKDDETRWKMETELINSKTVLVRFNYSATPLFGFLKDNDGEPSLIYPTKNGMYCVYL